MNPLLKQLSVLLREYERNLGRIKEKYSDPEYLAWISMLDSSQYPTKGEFPKARADDHFRAFRLSFKSLSTALQEFQWSALPYSVRTEYQQKFVREEGGVPF